VWSKPSAAAAFFAVFAAMSQVLQWEFKIVHCDGTARAGQVSRALLRYSTLMFAPLMSGHHLSISDL
jgi:hypothetical protein